jgi:hypothetical protein
LALADVADRAAAGQVRLAVEQFVDGGGQGVGGGVLTEVERRIVAATAVLDELPHVLSGELAGVEIANVSDSGRLPDTDVTASQSVR